ncbi:glycosyltransferase [Georgenia sp. SYP-B2076]|uniref:glycosyltransferase n=1 Tax=Georgenia sp. SYP-B2076 TaxID=2495881 RepID=UPI000F8DA0A3|nr:glycosyltransferase [Georgenia sp. SYP-B2076]
MFVFLLMLRHAFVEDGTVYLFAVFSAIVWALWLIKILLSRRYRPWTKPHVTTTSVVIPVVDEPLDLFRDVLMRICAQSPTETIVVINGPRNVELEQVCAEFADDGVVFTWTPIPGKRNAVKVGTEMATGDILVLVDSDTIWARDTLTELVKPFADPRIGGASTSQRILDPSRAFVTRWADWLENSRVKYSMPAQSALGQIGCLPGRTIAFRRQIVLDVMDEFMHARFLGVFLEVSDDRTLTNLTLKQGYRTVLQSTSMVWTDAPTDIRKLAKQQLRWARGSQYNTLRMLPWMLANTPVLAMFFLTDIILPFLLAGAVIGAVHRVVTGTGVNFYGALISEYGSTIGVASVVVLTLLATGLSMGVRHLRHLVEVPGDWWRMPLYVVFSTVFLMPIRLLGFFRMAHVAGWGTRKDAYAGTSTDDATDDLIAELEATGDAGPVDVVDRTDEFPKPSAGGPATTTAEHGAVTTRTRPAVAVRTAPAPSTRRRLNPLAAIPYLIGLTVFAIEGIYLV